MARTLQDEIKSLEKEIEALKGAANVSATTPLYTREYVPESTGVYRITYGDGDQPPIIFDGPTGENAGTFTGILFYKPDNDAGTQDFHYYNQAVNYVTFYATRPIISVEKI